MIPQKSKNQETDIILIRHAESQWNNQTEKIAQELNLQGDWGYLISHQEFNKRLTYNTKFIDSPLSQRGLSQCQKRSKALQKINVDLILVSPQVRALQTCKGLFGTRKIPVRVEPLLMQIIRYACDVSIDTKTKKQMFPQYDFSKVEQLGDDWSLQILPKEKRQLILNYYQKNEANTREKKQKAMLELLKNHEFIENDIDIRKRIAQLKHNLKELKKQFPVIALVSHCYTIEIIKAKGFDKNGYLLSWFGIDNCHPYYENLQKLLKVI